MNERFSTPYEPFIGLSSHPLQMSAGCPVEYSQNFRPIRREEHDPVVAIVKQLPGLSMPANHFSRGLTRKAACLLNRVRAAFALEPLFKEQFQQSLPTSPLIAAERGTITSKSVSGCPHSRTDSTP